MKEGLKFALSPGPVIRFAYHVISTGEFREPLKGEYFLSGAIPEGYRATCNMTSKYWIGELREGN